MKMTKGEWKNGLRNGFGKMTFISGDTYEGYWKDDKHSRNGKFRWKRKNRREYEGEWENGLQQGPGIEYTSNVNVVSTIQ